MPCAQVARGIRQAAPHTGPPFNDTTDNNPCGKPHVLTIRGVDVSAASLCIGHFALKFGLAVFDGPVITTRR